MGKHGKEDERNVPLMSERAYNWIKAFSLIILPALGALYFGLSEIWHLPLGKQIVGTITLIDTFLGVLTGAAAHSWKTSDDRYDGHIELITDEKDRTLVHISSINDITDKTEATFKIT